LGCGWLCDISVKGAKFLLDRTLENGDRISLDVDFRHPDGAITTIRFPAIVKRVSAGSSYEIAVYFLKGESYITPNGGRNRRRTSSSRWVSSANKWIN